MKKYDDFIKDSQKVYLDDNKKGDGFYTKKYGNGYTISALNNRILKYITSIYGPFGFEYEDDNEGDNEDINVEGIIINSEYISKMVNNYTIFKTFIREFSISEEEDFYRKLVSNFDNVYHYNGDFFKRQSLPILINTTRKGNINEEKSLNKFKEVIGEKGFDVKIERPTIKEDKKGVDGKFLHNGKYYTIQVKPFSQVYIKDGKIYATSKGSLSLGVNYLVLYKDGDYIILKNPSNDKIKIDGQSFVYGQNHILFTSV